jgi:MYXO-CTERM domain-containing protein
VTIHVLVNVSSAGNVPPAAAPAPGSAFSGTMATGFTLNAQAGQALDAATLLISDADGDAIEIISVSANATLPGVTAPAAQGPTAGPFNIAWSGAPGAEGTYAYTVSITDGKSPAVSFSVTLNVNMPELLHKAGPDAMGGEGTPEFPYLARTWAGQWPNLAMVELVANDRATLFSLTNVEAHAGNPDGQGFTLVLAGNMLHAVANGPLREADLGAHRFIATVSDGSLMREVSLHISVGTPEAEATSGSSCSSQGKGSPTWLALSALCALALIRRKMLAARYRY